jgi:hypothetical protein
MDKIVIVGKHVAYLIFYDREPVRLSSDRDIREMIYWLLDIQLRLVNDDITQEINLDEAA